MEKIKVCVTGHDGFIGKNLLAHLELDNDLEIRTIKKDTPGREYEQILHDVDVVYHLAGINRPENAAAFENNVQSIKQVLDVLRKSFKPVKLVVTSSTQATLDNPYGKSKLVSENIIQEVSAGSKIEAIIYRLPGVFGKWSRPNYNSVVATFCYNAANGIPLEVRDPQYSLSLVFIDDVVNSFLEHLHDRSHKPGCTFATIPIGFTIELGQLATIINNFKNNSTDPTPPSVSDLLVKYLYSTYLTFIPVDLLSIPMALKADNRGNLFEWIKSNAFGQIFISTTSPGITRGNHYHHTKTEQFLVIRGEAEIKLRRIDEVAVTTYKVNGLEPNVIMIPPGYTHNITNTGNSDLITLFWANEIFDPNKTDTFSLEV